jgi:hypothetical protein
MMLLEDVKNRRTVRNDFFGALSLLAVPFFTDVNFRVTLDDSLLFFYLSPDSQWMTDPLIFIFCICTFSAFCNFVIFSVVTMAAVQPML